MATHEYQYQYIKHDKLVECLHWLQNQCQLRDWSIDLDTNYEPPKELATNEHDNYEALALITTDCLKAVIWIPIKRLKEANRNPIEALCHEVGHILIDRCGMKDEDELLVRIISPMIYRLWCKEHRVKIAKVV